MIENYKQKIPLNKFINDGQLFEAGNPSDYISYLEFIKYFSNIDVIERHHLIIGINFTYGWMPTIFQFKSDAFDEAITILNNVKSGRIPSVDELIVLRKLFNNSIVGSSKILHFINPEKFAIFDSRVYRYLTGKGLNSDRKLIYLEYLDYLTYCNYLTNDSTFQPIHDNIITMIGYNMTKMRTGELIMYYYGGGNKYREL